MFTHSSPVLHDNFTTPGLNDLWAGLAGQLVDQGSGLTTSTLLTGIRKKVMKEIKTERRLSASLTTRDTCEFANRFVDFDNADFAALVRLLRNKAFLVEMCETPTFRHQHEVYHKSHREFDLTERVTA